MATFDATKNFAKVTVSTGYAAGATSIVLASGHGARLPQPSTDGEFNLVWWNNTDYGDPSDDPNREIVRCTARSTDTLTVTRAQESTSDTIKNIAGKTYRMALTITAKVIDDITGNIIDTPVSPSNGGTGLTSLGTAGQVPIVNSGATAMEWGSAGHDGVTTYSANTAGYLTCGNSSGNLAAFQAVSDGSFRTTVDGTAYNVDGIDFSTVTQIASGGDGAFGTNTNITNTLWLAVPFNSGTGTNVSKVRIQLTKNTSNKTVRISIRSSLTGSDIESKTAEATLSGPNYNTSYYDFNFSSPVTVTASTSYYIIMRVTTSGNYVRADSHTSSGPTSSDSGSTWYSGGATPLFQVSTKDVVDMNDVASTIQTALRTATGGSETVIYSTDHLLLTSGTAGIDSEVSLMTTSTGTVGTDIKGSSYCLGDTGNATATAGTSNEGKVGLLNSDGVLDGDLIGGAIQSSSSRSANTVYDEGVDGFVTGYSDLASSDVNIYSDATATPTTLIMQINCQTGDSIPYCCPIKKGDKWRLTQSSSGGDNQLRFTPLGN